MNNTPLRIVQSHDELVMQFVANCVQWAADSMSCDYLSMFKRMDKVGLIENYIMKFYDVLHCESRQNITQDIVETLVLWETKNCFCHENC